LIPKVGIVVPTLGKRPDYLNECLESIKRAGGALVILVAPKTLDAQELASKNLITQHVNDPGLGLPAAINLGISSFPKEVEYVNWLGDDDLLCPGSLTLAKAELEGDPRKVLIFGSCEYIDERGDMVWKNKSGQWAVPLLRFGPDLIAQPGALFRREAFEKIGRLNLSFDWAFDFDLFIKLSKVGKVQFINSTLAKFRWHPESLSVQQRKSSVLEASRVRKSHLPRILKPISWLWEYPVMQATLMAGNHLSAKAKKRHPSIKGVG